MKQVILIGDSIRTGYEDVVRAQLEGWADIWSPKENGGSSRNVLAHLEEWVISRAPDIVHLNCGLHDLRKEYGQPETAVPLQEYEENVGHIMDRIASGTQALIIWAATTPVNERWHHKNKGFDRFEADVRSYNASAGRIAKRPGIPINDLFAIVESAGKNSVLLPDGVHFTPEGYVKLGKAVALAIKPHVQTAQQLRRPES